MSDPIESAMAEAELMFAAAAKANNNWHDVRDTKALPPWWPVGVGCVWILLDADFEFWPSLRVSDYREQAIPVLRGIAHIVFERFLKPYQRRMGQLWVAEAVREEFADHVVAELLPRVTERALGASANPPPPQGNDLRLGKSSGVERPQPQETEQVRAEFLPRATGRVVSSTSALEPLICPDTTQDTLSPASMARRPTRDPFATKDQREEAVTRAAQKLGGKVAVAAACKVDYGDLRKWVRQRDLAKGRSAKVGRIEEMLFPHSSPL